MGDSAPEGTAFKPKKSVALSGVTTGNTALCTVGRTGNDLHYRGYDILEIANTCEFEEIAFLLVHGKLPTRSELEGYKAKLKSLRGLPGAVREALVVGKVRAPAFRPGRPGRSVRRCAVWVLAGRVGAWVGTIPAFSRSVRPLRPRSALPASASARRRGPTATPRPRSPWPGTSSGNSDT